MVNVLSKWKEVWEKAVGIDDRKRVYVVACLVSPEINQTKAFVLAVTTSRVRAFNIARKYASHENQRMKEKGFEDVYGVIRVLPMELNREHDGTESVFDADCIGGAHIIDCCAY